MGALMSALWSGVVTVRCLGKQLVPTHRIWIAKLKGATQAV